MNKHYLYVCFTGIVSGLIVFSASIFSKMGFSLYEISIFPTLPILLLLLPFILLKKDCRMRVGMLPLLILMGFVLSVITLSQYCPVLLGVPVSVVVFLLYTQPLWTIIIAKLFLKEKLSKTKLLAAAIVLVGMIVLINPFNESFRVNLVGILIALLGGISLSGWVVVGSVLSKKGNNIMNTEFWGGLFAVILMLLSLPLLSLFVKDATITDLSFGHNWLSLAILFAYGVVVLLLTHLSYFEGAKKVPAIDAGIILLLEPVVGTLLSVAYLKQAITANILIGGILILIANYLVIRAAREKRK